MSNSNPKKRSGEPQQEEGRPKGTKGAATSLAVELEADVLDCPICSEPLRPPIFQCAVGHLICSACCDKVPNLKKCHQCSRKCNNKRCYGIEKIVRSVKIPCRNSKYGCDVKTTYYEKEDHEASCPSGPCFCPETGCSFVGSTRMLLRHFILEHHWPYTEIKYGWGFDAKIQHGFRVLSCEDGKLFLLNVSSEVFGCVVSVFYVGYDVEPKFRCAIYFNFGKNNSFHSHFSEFPVPSTTLSDGIPRNCFLFIVPKSYIEKDSKISLTMKKA
ncbi:hypothetical protein EJB05_31814 [Eragrostis curvula]|uniref:RING-type E3 ubiquitin transferase n=1 Tax=Eragrostis curvula TaxID=38414 RepID=A0A5J9UEK3_9POAL|nr:hypothetical protein EJB05_31814 [Eragrostis curvula]